MYPGFTIAHCRASEYPVNVQVIRSGRFVGLVDAAACPTASEEAVAEWAAPWWNRHPGDVRRVLRQLGANKPQAALAEVEKRQCELTVASKDCLTATAALWSYRPELNAGPASSQ